MNFDLDEFTTRLQKLVQATAIVKVRTLTMDLFAMLGLDRAYFVSPVTLDQRIGRNVASNGLSDEWERQYRNRLRLVDPLPTIALRITGAFVWPDEIGEYKIDAKGLRYMELAAEYGLGRGLGMATYGPQGRVGFIGAPLPDDAPLPSDLPRARFNMIGQLSFQVYCKIVRPEEEMQPLSNRELEVLQLIGAGKSNSVIAELLGISSSSVDMYVRRIFAKLSVADRTSASVKAFSLGLIGAD